MIQTESPPEYRLHTAIAFRISDKTTLKGCALDNYAYAPSKKIVILPTDYAQELSYLD